MTKRNSSSPALRSLSVFLPVLSALLAEALGAVLYRTVEPLYTKGDELTSEQGSDSIIERESERVHELSVTEIL